MNHLKTSLKYPKGVSTYLENKYYTYIIFRALIIAAQQFTFNGTREDVSIMVSLSISQGNKSTFFWR